jgi:dihydroorotase
MTCYLTDNVAPDELDRGHGDGVWVAAKLYPAGATTNSASGVTVRHIYPALERMQQIGMVFCIHGSHRSRRRVFDRAVFIDRILTPLVQIFPISRSCLSTSHQQRRNMLPAHRPRSRRQSRRSI